ncbi:hypothetical protein DERF_008808 [Dermatophagoides farinae]|uniref:Uncharacterized protein n=1 Tax=Dermatophagoides farinae TaxID=6954 RepID=A0A922L9L5_DERFA|nr:hypothetical protein DERF_008808 [Dermatophagoides farinae]
MKNELNLMKKKNNNKKVKEFITLFGEGIMHYIWNPRVITKDGTGIRTKKNKRFEFVNNFK